MLEKVFITGTGTVIASTILVLATYYLPDSEDLAAWITLIISAGIGIAIAIIIDEKAEKSHQQVIKSQDNVTNLLKVLNETDQKHKEVLSSLNESKIRNEKLADDSVRNSLEYITDMIDKIFKVVDLNNLKNDDMKLVKDVLIHIESPLNLIIQTLPHSSQQLKENEMEIYEFTKTLRKLVIASIVISKSELTKELLLLKTTNEELKKIREKLN